MGSRSGGFSGTFNLTSPVSLGVTLSDDEYPSGTISWDGGVFWQTRGLSNGYHYYFDLYLCDSGGSNEVKFATVDIVGNSSGYGTDSSTRSGSISGTNGQKLRGKSLYMKAKFSSMSPSGSFNYGTQYFEMRCSSYVTMTINTNSAYSPSTFSAGNVNFGETSRVSISIKSAADVYHVVKWQVGSHSSTSQLGTNVTTATYTIPSSWMDAVPSSTAATLTITVTTYKTNGSSVGSNSGSYTASVPSSVVPSISSVVASIYNQHSNISDVYFQTLTGVRITVNASGNGSASISAYSIAISPTETATQSGNNFYVSELKNSGTISFNVTVTDSRGRTASASTSITVQAYREPMFRTTTAFRCNAIGVADEEGLYASIRAVVEYTEYQGNSVTINSTYFSDFTPEYTAQNNMTSGATYIIGNGTLDPNIKYKVKFVVTDTIGGSNTLTIIVQTAAYAIHVKNGGAGVAFGKVSEEENAVEINEGWNLFYKGFITLPVIYRATTGERDAITNPPTGLVCLVKKT